MGRSASPAPPGTGALPPPGARPPVAAGASPTSAPPARRSRPTPGRRRRAGCSPPPRWSDGAPGPCSWCCLVPATNRHRDENAEKERSSFRDLAMSSWDKGAEPIIAHRRRQSDYRRRFMYPCSTTHARLTLRASPHRRRHTSSGSTVGSQDEASRARGTSSRRRILGSSSVPPLSQSPLRHRSGKP